MKLCLFLCAAAAAVKPPTISLDLSTALQLQDNTTMWSSTLSSVSDEGHALGFGDQTTTGTYGASDGNEKTILYRHARVSDATATDIDGQTVTAHRDLTLRCAADQRLTSTSCKLPAASATDHHDTTLVVKSRIYHVRDNDGTAVSTDTTALETYTTSLTGESHCETDACIESTLAHYNAYTQRGNWLVKYDCKDGSGNRADQLVVAITFDDHTAPQFTAPPISSATDLNLLKCPTSQALEAWSSVLDVEHATDYLCHALTGRTNEATVQNIAAGYEYDATNTHPAWSNAGVNSDTRDHEAAFDNVATGGAFSVTSTMRYDVTYTPSDATVAAWTDGTGTNNFCADCTAQQLAERLGDPRTKVGSFAIVVKISDFAGVYGVNGVNNVNSYTRTVTVSDNKIPVITLRTQTDVGSSQPNCAASTVTTDSGIPIGNDGECCTTDDCSTVYQQCGYNYNDNYATAADDLDDHCTAMDADYADGNQLDTTYSSTITFPVAGSPSGTFNRIYKCQAAKLEWNQSSWVPASISPSTGLTDGSFAMTTGDYTITYEATDRNLNKAANVTRLVKVIDTDVPVPALYPTGVDEVVHFASRSGETTTNGNPTDFKKYGSGSIGDDWMNPDAECTMTASTETGFQGNKTVSPATNDARGDSCTEPGISCWDMCDSSSASRTPEKLIVTAEWVHFWAMDVDSSTKKFDHHNYDAGRACDSNTPCEYDDRIVGKWRRQYTCTDLSGNSATITRDFVNADKDKPYIVPNQDSNTASATTSRYEAVYGAVYTEPGAVCKDWHRHDDYDPNTNSAAHPAHVIENMTNVATGEHTGTHLTITQVDPTTKADCSSCSATDISVPGTYVVKYECSDHAGNVADPHYRTVIVVDDMKPVITLAHNSNTCSSGNTCTQEAGFTFTDPGVTLSDANNMDNSFALRDVVITATFTPGTGAPATDATGISQLTSTANTAGVGATLTDPQVGTYEITYNVEDYWHTDTVTKCGSRPGSNTNTCTCSGDTGGDGSVSCNQAVAVTRTLTVTDTLKPVITLHDASGSLNPVADSLSSESSPFHTSEAADTAVHGEANPAGIAQTGSAPYMSGSNPNLSLMAEQRSYTNGWIVAGVASAVAGVALLAAGSRRKQTSVPV